MRKAKIYGTVFVMIAFILVSCSSNIESDQIRGKILIDGSSTVAPVTGAIIEIFQEENNVIDITMGISGTGGGFKKFISGETAISNASRPMKPEEKAAAAENGVKYYELGVAKDAIAFVINPENTWLENISIEQLAEIWKKDSVITRWSDLDSSYPDEKINLFGPGTDSGTYDYFREVSVGAKAEIRSDYTASEDDNVLVIGVSGDKYALGYFGFIYYAENQNRLKSVPINGVEPSEKTVNSGAYTPLSRPLYIYVNKSEYQENPAVKLFVDYYLETVSNVVIDLGYPALTAAEYESEREKLKD
ncbi:phosphate ABC transporter substrate-binding protein [Erysipelotrichaceae bacterium]|nr:phosphate ABC transporter substrate-binding protein [Erysipelotrichaceae bacterium]